MPGLNWTDRRDGDWLASNGRWYPPKDYPRGWSMSSLPPAPGHDLERGTGGLFSSAARSFQTAADSAAKAVGSEPGATAPPRPTTATPPPAAARPKPSQTAQPIRRTPGLADAVVVSQSTHRSRLDPGAAPSKGLPPAPGRVSEDAPDLPKAPPPSSSPPPPKSSVPPPRSSPPPPTRSPSTSSSGPKRPPMPTVGNAKSGVDSVSGELGRALGSARSKLDRAIESME